MICALIGYAGSGKTELAGILCGKKVESFDPHKPVVLTPRVVDRRLEKLAAIVSPAKTTAPELTIHDVRGPVRSAGFDEKIIGLLTDPEMLLLVVDGFFENKPADDIASLCLEFIYRDTERLEGLRERRAEEVRNGRRKENPAEEAAIGKALELLASEHLLSSHDFPAFERSFLNSLNLVTLKKLCVLVNGPECTNEVKDFCGERHLPLFSFACTAAVREDLEILWKGLLEHLGLRIFFTEGPKEVRGWLMKAGGVAPDAAAAIHTDLAKGFIRAEVTAYDDFIAAGGNTAVLKEKGQVRLEGKEYLVKDGDILLIRFSK